MGINNTKNKNKRTKGECIMSLFLGKITLLVIQQNIMV